MRLTVNLATGETLALQLPNELGEWQRRALDPGFQGSIRGVGVIRGTEHVVLPVPKLFNSCHWDVKVAVGTDKALRSVAILAMADDVMVTSTVYNTGTPSMTKVDVRRIGKRRWQP
jgi:hypothetical protein